MRWMSNLSCFGSINRHENQIKNVGHFVYSILLTAKELAGGSIPSRPPSGS